MKNCTFSLTNADLVLTVPRSQKLYLQKASDQGLRGYRVDNSRSSKETYWLLGRRYRSLHMSD